MSSPPSTRQAGAGAVKSINKKISVEVANSNLLGCRVYRALCVPVVLRDTCNRYFSCQIVRGSHTDPGKLQSESIRINRRDLSCRVGACRLPRRLLPPMRPSSVDTQSTIAFSVSVAPPGRHRLACYSYVSPVVLAVTAVSFDVFEPPGPGREERPNARRSFVLLGLPDKFQMADAGGNVTWCDVQVVEYHGIYVAAYRR